MLVFAANLISHGSEVANSTNLLTIAKNVTFTTVDASLWRYIKYPVQFAILIDLCGFSYWFNGRRRHAC